MAIKYSIIVPTYNRRDLVKQCLDSIKANTDLTQVEVIVVCNGCEDQTPELVSQYGFKYVYHPEPLGFARAVNLGIVLAQGEYIVLLNNDVVLLGSNWLSLLEEPFKRHLSCGITGPSPGERAGVLWIVFFCAMIKSKLFKEIGLLDTAFGLGGGEDTDFGIKAHRLGYTSHQVPLGSGNLTATADQPTIGCGQFPLWHPGGQTCNDHLPGFARNYQSNAELLEKRYGQ